MRMLPSGGAASARAGSGIVASVTSMLGSEVATSAASATVDSTSVVLTSVVLTSVVVTSVVTGSVLSGIVDSSAGAAVGVGSVTAVSVASSEELHAVNRTSGRTATMRDLRM